MRYPQTFIEEVVNRTQLSGIIGKTIKLVPHGNEHQGLCPFHKEKTPSFYVNDNKGVYNCFGCGAGGNVFDFLEKTQGYSFPEALTFLANQAGVAIPQPTEENSEEAGTQEKIKRFLAICDVAATFFHEMLFAPQGSRFRKYALDRGLDLQTLKNFKVGFAPPGNLLRDYLLKQSIPENDLVEVGLLIRSQERNDTYSRFRNRLMFPIFDRQGRIIAFGGRALGDEKPKYLNSPESIIFHKRSTLYGFNIARQTKQKSSPLIVCEGYLDVIALHQAGFTGAVAPLGTALTESHLKMIWQVTDSPFVCFDGDAAGIKAAQRTVEISLPHLTSGNSLKLIQLPEGEDPDSLIHSKGSKAFEDVLKTAEDFSDYLWKMILSKTGFKTPSQKAAALQEIAEVTAKIQDTRLRNALSQYLRGKYYEAVKSKKIISKGATEPKLTRPGSNDMEFLSIVFLAAILNYPSLLESYFEDLAHLEIASPPLSKLRDQILHYFEEYHHTDLTELIDSMTKAGYQTIMEKILSQKTYMLAPFTRPDQDIQDVERDLSLLLMRHKSQHFEKTDLQPALKNFGESMTNDSWEQIKALKFEKETLDKLSRTTDEHGIEA